MLHFHLMPLYTKLGDTGDTMLYGGERISKDAPRIHAYGTVDELDALLGAILTEDSVTPDAREKLTEVQHALYVIKSDLAAPLKPDASEESSVTGPKRVTQEQVEELERWIDEAEGKVLELLHFILPGGSRVAALLHQARTVCRRAERWVVALSKQDKKIGRAHV